MALAIVLALSFRLVDVFGAASQALQADIVAAFSGSGVPSVSNDLVFEDHQQSLCCADFVRGGQLVLIVVLFSGLPMSLAACTAALAGRLRSPRRWPHSAAGFFQACFVLQWSSLLLSAALTMLFLLIDWRAAFAEWQGLFLLVTTTASALALPAWRAAALAVAVPAPISIVHPQH